MSCLCSLLNSQNITIIVRPASVEKTATKALASRGFPILPLDATTEVDPTLLKGFDVIISAVDNDAYEDQSRLATAAKAAGVSRFVPCGFTIVVPAGGVMTLRDGKEKSYQDILKLKLGYTFIDVGFWHQFSYPRVPSGKLDYSLLFVEPHAEVFGDGTALNLLTDLRDIGKFVASIVQDPRTLNKKVFTWSDELSQNDTFAIVERLTNEQVVRKHVSLVEVERIAQDARIAYQKEQQDREGQPVSWSTAGMVMHKTEYNVAKYVREDNTRSNALYLGYLDARELYPEFEPMSFEKFIEEAVAGNAPRPYKGRL